MIGTHKRMGRYMELRASGTLSPEQILLKVKLELLRETDFVAYVFLRAQTPVRDLIALEGGQQLVNLTTGRGAFSIEEIAPYKEEGRF